MTISVLICTYNRHDLLDTAIRSIVEGCDEKPDELVVVNGGDEQTDEVVNRYVGTGTVDVRLIKTVNVNLANSRNIGLAECRGEVVAMTDDDAEEVFPDWIRRIRVVFDRNPGAGAVGGRVIGTNRESLVGKVADAITFPELGRSARCQDPAGREHCLSSRGPGSDRQPGHHAFSR